MYVRIIIFFLFPMFALAQTPQKINFQSIIRNSSGEVVGNKGVNMRISILSGSSSGNNVSSESHVKTTDATGLVSLEMGTGTLLSGVFSSIDWGNTAHFIKLEADFTGGTTYELLGTQELMSVPYALYAGKSDTSVLNLTSRLATKLNVTDTAFLSNRIDDKLTKTDTASLSNRIDDKLTKTDTSFLSNRIDLKLTKTDTASLSNRIDFKLTKTDTASLSNRIDFKLTKTDTASLSNRIDFKLTKTDTVSLSNRIDFKLTKTDTVSLSDRIDFKLTKTDTASLSNRIDLNLTKTDTASLSNRIDDKLTKTDTTTMLSTYLRKTDAIIIDLQNQVTLLSSYTSLLASGLVDIDGNNYPVVKIGNQIWMKENLRVSRYRNGDLIPIVTDNAAWGALTTGGRSWYNNDSTRYENPYGNLYNWYAVTDNRGLCPYGWHAPTDAAWTILTTYLGGESIAGGKMKSTGTAYWYTPNTAATNESGFSVLPGGFRKLDGSFKFISINAFFWSATEYAFTNAWLRYLNANVGSVVRPNYDKSVGASVRCLRD